MKKIKLVLLFSFFTILSYSQDLSTLKNVDISSLSDNQIASYWKQIQESGYTMDQVEAMAKVQGIPTRKIAEFKRRVSSLSQIEKVTEKNSKNNAIKEKIAEPYGLEDVQVEKNNTESTQLFGYDFFNNSKISFSPSVNIAVPANYQIGPGDELMIDLWGASEITYTATVDRTGNIKINGVGFIYVNGFSLENASKKIISKLKKKHAGIGAPNNSYSRINTNVTVSKIRTVQVNIIGEVKAPGTYALNSLSTVLNALYVAGGPSKMGTFREVKLVRDNKTVAVLDIYEYLLFGTQKGNLKLQDQDVLLVGPYKNLVSVEGAVKRTGIYELRDGENLADLISYFGGFSSKAYTDLLLLERLNGTQKEVKEVRLNEASTFLMQPGDKIVVQEVLDLYKNRVAIAGEVYRPGDFELTKGMTLKDLLLKSEGVTPEAFLERGILTRTYDNSYKENIPFKIQSILSGTTNIVLQNKDRAEVFNKDSLRESRYINISGAINKPGKLDFVEKMQIEDVIALSGGLTEGADPNVVSISRRLKDGSFKTLSEVFTISSEKNLAINKGEPFYLQPFDEINIRQLMGYVKQKTVKITGEVNYSGNYVLKTKNERISDLIKRAKGLTEFAYPEGATLLRMAGNSVQNKLTYNVDDEGVSNDKLEQLSSITISSIGIDLIAILKNPGSEIDLILNEGDELVIPELKQTVKVSGEVLQPSLVQFVTNASLKDYVSNSGGFTNAAKKSKIFVRYSNGDIKTVKKFLFFKFYPKLAPGSDIFVPAKAKSENGLSTQEILGITTSLATLGVLVQSLTNK
ncbi:MAG: SLBB domain-containing protein [Flavobacteriaceae bacterium]